MIVRRRRFVLDGKPVLLSTFCLPAALVAGTAITRPGTGAGGTYARLAELGAAPVRFREDSAHAARRAAYSGISAMGGRSSVSTSVVRGTKPCSPRSNWVSRGRTKWPRVRRSWAVR